MVKHIQMEFELQEHAMLVILKWQGLDLFQKFLFFVLKSSDVLEILVPILFYLNDSRADQCEYGEGVCVGGWVYITVMSSDVCGCVCI